ncbi:MAG: hypothetical protein OEU26_10810 [Candidatus Tectomicrobia bacterium]|nr:hypothetical protein [Candidatus Tectomicrobia bacterium]
MSIELNLATFADREQETFYLTANDVQLEMKLVEVTQIKLPKPRKWGTPQPVFREEPFSLVFQGPTEPPLHQSIYPMRHGDMGELGGIFMVPIAADAQGRYYEAVFN